MPWVPIIPEEEATGPLRAAYERIRGQRGKVANVVAISGLLPDVMERNMDFYVALMFGQHKLSRARREMVAVEVSRANQCNYCVNHHGAALARAARNQTFADQFMELGDAVVTNDQDKAMLAYTRKLTVRPTEVTQQDVEALRRAGFDDEEIVGINHVVGFFNMMNRFVLGLGIELESDKGADPVYKY